MLLTATKEEIDAQSLKRMEELAFFAVHLGVPGAYGLDFVFRTKPSHTGQQEPLHRIRLDPVQVQELVGSLTHAMKVGKEAASIEPKDRH